jgi:hypothetical protein
MNPPTTRLRYDVDAGEPRHPPVDDGDVVVIGPEVGKGGIPVADGIHDVAVLAEPAVEDGAQGPVVLGDEYPHGPVCRLFVSPLIPPRYRPSMTEP